VGEVENGGGETVQGGNGAGREMERRRVQGRVSYSPLNRFGGDTLPASSVGTGG